MNYPKFEINPLANIKIEMADCLSDAGYNVKDLIMKYDKLKLYSNIQILEDLSNLPSEFKYTSQKIIYHEIPTKKIKEIFKTFNKSIIDKLNLNDNYNPVASRMNAQLLFSYTDDKNWELDVFDLCDLILKTIETNSQHIKEKSLSQIIDKYNKMQIRNLFLPHCILYAIIYTAILVD